ncbi:glutamate--cysteine ligase [Loigolactobacillus backii]|uniref:glutamate--cysteine ligase n=1 Tax=Loigolactobacillus backii TaxID=375175 RepID=UPI000C1CB5DE|nr:glutamate--cysteine ligase [Loigolactobacillus backii]PIO82515.1 glutamate--cysteine ligase [Loigolactobacillus backii]
MFDSVGKAIFDQELVSRSSDFTMGIEVEMHRIDENGRLSKEPYPNNLGDQAENQFIKNDFVQTQLEVITPPIAHSVSAMNYLLALNNTLRNALQPTELLWPLSMPPVLPKDKTNISIAATEPKKKKYLEAVAKRYGFTNGLPSGVHINLSIDQRIFDIVYPEVADRFKNRTEVVNAIYVKVAQQFMRYRWLLIYLFGASPIAEANYFSADKAQPEHPVRSLRSSHYGFYYEFVGDYTSVAKYVQVITDAVASDRLLSESEYHGSVRLKGTGKLADVPKKGVDYLELRMLDLDPTTSVGIRTETVRFIRILMSYFMMSPGIATGQVNKVMKKSAEMLETVALEIPNEPTVYQAQAQEFLDQLQLFGDQVQWGPEYQEVMDVMRDRLDNPEHTPAANLVGQMHNGSLTEYALKMAQRYQKRALRNIEPFNGFKQKPTLDESELRRDLFKGNWEPRN